MTATAGRAQFQPPEYAAPPQSVLTPRGQLTLEDGPKATPDPESAVIRRL